MGPLFWPDLHGHPYALSQWDGRRPPPTGAYLGIELGSTHIKAVAIDETFKPVTSGNYTWKSSYENSVWNYVLEDAWTGLKAAPAGVEGREDIAATGMSAMMHGYLAFDADWNLLTPFRTCQSTITAQAAKELSQLFGLNIPQRWSIAYLYQAILNGEEHVGKVAKMAYRTETIHPQEFQDKHYLHKHDPSAYYGQR